MAFIQTRWSKSRPRTVYRRASPERPHRGNGMPVTGCRQRAPRSPQRFRRAAVRAVLFAVLLAGTRAHAALDLQRASVERLDNGLTVLVLEEPAFPLVSVQMLYRTGARDERVGRTGLAHFVEHMAFRGSKNFPDTGLVSSIYAVGGEWHGYTYLDQTTYFATVPAARLDLLLRIEADRMSRLALLPEDIPAERGAVLAEMHGYENDAAAMLHDAAIYVSLIAHPYRNNTIGWEDDVRAITRADVAQFYERHYQPGNAVLAVVGDVDSSAVLARVRELFGPMAGRPASALPVTAEPAQQGVRRIRLQGPVARKWFQIVWHAPAAVDADYPAFLLAQELLSASPGVNFLHNDWGTPARAGSLLDGVADDISTWMMPTAQPYVFAVKGSLPPAGDEQRLESAVAAAVAKLNGEAIDAAALAEARERLLTELVLDVQTTEDAAHQLAFFSGIDALDVLLTLPERLAAVQPADVRRVAAHYLDADRRTIAWSVPGAAAADVPARAPAPAVARHGTTTVRAAAQAAPPAELARLSNGVPVLLKPSPMSPTVHLEAVLPGPLASDAAALDDDRPVTGVTAYNTTVPAAELEAAIVSAAQALRAATPRPAAEAASSDPYTRMEQAFRQRMWTPAAAAGAAPRVIAVAGDFDRVRVLASLEQAFGDLAAAPPQEAEAPAAGAADLQLHIPLPLAQARVGYLVTAPPPDSAAADAWRALLYILSHGYEGRLGKAAISRRGLVYYIDSRYRSDGEHAYITLSAGVDPAKLGEMRELLAAELERLKREPPDSDEVAEALAHRLGRARSAAQSNSELADALAADWLWYGEALSPAALEARLARIERQDVLDAIDAFVDGTLITVTVEH
ncbi:MAG TPA: insulinase family protein [Woeseiaceae bacterium]|nr:insulinase family protein [Woeseiaceae bacterium]